MNIYFTDEISSLQSHSFKFIAVYVKFLMIVIYLLEEKIFFFLEICFKYLDFHHDIIILNFNKTK
jgi:hypothetical protein